MGHVGGDGVRASWVGGDGVGASWVGGDGVMASWVGQGIRLGRWHHPFLPIPLLSNWNKASRQEDGCKYYRQTSLQHSKTLWMTTSAKCFAYHYCKCTITVSVPLL